MGVSPQYFIDFLRLEENRFRQRFHKKFIITEKPGEINMWIDLFTPFLPYFDISTFSAHQCVIESVEKP